MPNSSERFTQTRYELLESFKSRRGEVDSAYAVEARSAIQHDNRLKISWTPMFGKYFLLHVDQQHPFPSYCVFPITSILSFIPHFESLDFLPPMAKTKAIRQKQKKATAREDFILKAVEEFRMEYTRTWMMGYMVATIYYSPQNEWHHWHPRAASGLPRPRVANTGTEQGPEGMGKVAGYGWIPCFKEDDGSKGEAAMWARSFNAVVWVLAQSEPWYHQWMPI